MHVRICFPRAIIRVYYLVSIERHQVAIELRESGEGGRSQTGIRRKAVESAITDVRARKVPSVSRIGDDPGAGRDDSNVRKVASPHLAGSEITIKHVKHSENFFKQVRRQRPRMRDGFQKRTFRRKKKGKRNARAQRTLGTYDDEPYHHSNHILHPMDLAILVQASEILAPDVQRHSQDDGEHRHRELDHVHRDKAIRGRGSDIEDPVREREAKLSPITDQHFPRDNLMSSGTLLSRSSAEGKGGEQPRYRLTVFLRIVATIMISPLMGLKQSIA